MVYIVCGLVFMFCLWLELNDNKKKKNIDIEKYLKDNYDNVIESIVDNVIEESDYSDVKSEEELYCNLLYDIRDKLETILIDENIESNIMKQLTKESIESYLNNKLGEKDVSKIFDEKCSQGEYKGNDLNDEFAQEAVSNNTKIDSSKIDITQDLNDIFFNEF